MQIVRDHARSLICGFCGQWIAKGRLTHKVTVGMFPQSLRELPVVKTVGKLDMPKQKAACLLGRKHFTLQTILVFDHLAKPAKAWSGRPINIRFLLRNMLVLDVTAKNVLQLFFPPMRA